MGKIRREFRQINNVSFSQGSSWRMVALFPTTIFKKSQLCIWCLGYGAVSKIDRRAMQHAYEQTRTAVISLRELAILKARLGRHMASVLLDYNIQKRASCRCI